MICPSPRGGRRVAGARARPFGIIILLILQARTRSAGMRQMTVAAMAAIAMLAASAGLAGCASSTTSSSNAATAPAAGSSSASTASCSNSAIQSQLYATGMLTVATDKPVYPPWFINNKPTNGQGYESAVAYAVAARLGFKPSQVTWAYEPFDSSYAPGPKKFDFDINEISYST